MSLVAPDKYILITGASSGLGVEFAHEFAKRGHGLILTARREERLKALQQDLLSRYAGLKVQVIAEDLNESEAPQRIFSQCQEQGWMVGGLVNNAGLGFNKSFLQLQKNQVNSMLQVNMLGLVKLTYLFLPDMVQAKQGFVLNIASTAGFQAVPYFSVYAATKSFVLVFSEGLYEELKPKGVLVSCLCPGPTKTEFQEVSGMSPRFFAPSQSAKEVVTKGLKALESRQAVAWSSWYQRCSSSLSEWMPRFLRRKIAAWLMLKSGAK